MKPIHWIFLPLFIGISCSEALAGINVKVLHPQSVLDEIAVEGQGRVVLQKKNSLTSLAEGRVAKIFALVGDPVSMGQTLILLENPESERDAAAIKSKLDLNRRSLVLLARKERDAKELLDLGVMAKNEVSSLQNELLVKRMETSELQASLEKLRLRKKNQRILSKASGFLTQIVPEGSFLSYGQEAATILDPASEQIEALFPFERAPEIKPGQSAILSANGISVRGKVIRLFPSATANLVKVLISPTRPLPLDLNLQVKLRVKTRRGLMLPKSAVVMNDGRTFVFLLKGKKVQQREIHVDRAYDDRVILSGVSLSESVVVENASVLSDGTEVDFR
ncbi:MAG TPA: HlyD family efflux transporter periplasmic adaptor subunit [Chroococcales cyanobacterium]|jgi:RND family efflux transporter MFP subunit